MIVHFLAAVISMGVVYLYGSIGESIIEKGGSLNLGIPGIMCLGALGGVVGVNTYFAIFGANNVIGAVLILFAVIMSFVFAAAGGLLFALLTVTFQANQNVSGLVLTTFGAGLMKFIGQSMDDTNLAAASRAIKALFPNYQNAGWFGEIFLSHGFLVYLAFILAIVASIFLSKTRKGLFLVSIGESPQTADSQGINVTKYKYLSILIGSGIAGLGGLYFVMDRSGGTTFVEAPIETFGWMSVSLVIFSMWKPYVCIFGSVIFGGLYILPSFLNLPATQLKNFELLPYLATITVLLITSMVNNKNSQPPSALGINYYREER